MLSFITNLTDPLLDYIKDDPVRPDLSKEFRVGKNKFVSALVEDIPRAIVCVSLHDFIPEDVDDLSKDSDHPTTAIFYTIWSYAPGAGTEMAPNGVDRERIFVRPTDFHWLVYPSDIWHRPGIVQSNQYRFILAADVEYM